MTNDTREGLYAEWEWNRFRKCWEYSVPHRIYPMPDGRFVMSAAEVWIDGDAATFDEAEARALGISEDQFARDNATVDAMIAPPAAQENNDDE